MPRSRADVLVVLSGLPGTGKSAIAEGIARELSCPVLSVDPVESALLRAGVEAAQPTGLAAYAVVHDLADAQLRLGLATLVDAVNAVEAAREAWRALATEHDVPRRLEWAPWREACLRLDSVDPLEENVRTAVAWVGRPSS
jgi:predicted kinase